MKKVFFPIVAVAALAVLSVWTPEASAQRYYGGRGVSVGIGVGGYGGYRPNYGYGGYRPNYGYGGYGFGRGSGFSVGVGPVYYSQFSRGGRRW